MSRRRRDHRSSFLRAEFAPAAGVAEPPTPQPRKPATVTLRLTAEERDRLEELAAGMTLSAYIRACIFARFDGSVTLLCCNGFMICETKQ